MDFKDSYPDYAAVEELVRRARLEQTVAISQLIADAVVDTARGLRRIATAFMGVRPARPARRALSR